MGVLYDYFASGSDAAAGDLIDQPGGPAGPHVDGWPVPAAGAGSDPTSLQVIESASGTLVLESKGIDPIVQMGTLEALLTGVEYNQVVAGPRSGSLVASRDNHERLIVTLTDELQAALATADNKTLRTVAESWSATEEFRGMADPEPLSRFLHAMADLARRAAVKQQRLYCWICL